MRGGRDLVGCMREESWREACLHEGNGLAGRENCLGMEPGLAAGPDGSIGAGLCRFGPVLVTTGCLLLLGFWASNPTKENNKMII